jgi:two-component system sensor histidine kinase DegS
MKNSDIYRAARISIIYIAVAGSWIYFSDHLLAMVVPNLDLLTDLSSLKGIGFVVVTAGLLYIERLNSERANLRAKTMLEKAEHNYREVFESAPIGIFQSTADGKYTGANNVFAHMLGYNTPQELTSNLSDAAYGQPDNIFADMTRAGSKRMQYERQFHCKDGRMIDANVDLRLVNEDDGTPPYLEGFVENITERKAAERKIEQMADIVRSSQDAIYSVSPDNRFTSWNPSATRIYGYSPEEIEGKSSAILYAPDRLDERARLRKLVYSGQSISQYETVHVRKDGSRLNASLTYSPIFDASGHITGISAIVRDITERTQIMARLEEQQKALRAYAHRLIESQEEERKRLSRELHDDTLQDLVALAQRAELSHTALERDQAVAGRRLDELQSLAKDMIIKLRRISNDLRPLILEDLGIAAAIQFLGDELARQLPACTVRCTIEGDDQRLDPDVEITTFRIVQQAMNNVRMHAPNATSIDVELSFEQTGIKASVTDDGQGFRMTTIDELVRQGHLGLAGMVERALLLGGQVIVTSSPQTGTAVTMQLPYIPAPEGAESVAPSLNIKLIDHNA